MIDLGNWKDPNPEPVIYGYYRNQDFSWIGNQYSTKLPIKCDFYVVRDDLLGVGSKVRFVDYFIRNMKEKEIVFGSCPATGFAQISLPAVAKKYGKEVHLFMAKRNPDNYTDMQKRGIELGAIYHWVPDGMLPVTQARAREYTQEKPNDRFLFPIGLEHESVISSIVKVARDLPINPKYVWSVGSSGTLSRGLQKAWPDAEVHVVSVGHKMLEREKGRAILHKTDYKFDRKVKYIDFPPYPACEEYDAKIWRPFIEWFHLKYRDKLEGPILIWSVA